MLGLLMAYLLPPSTALVKGRRNKVEGPRRMGKSQRKIGQHTVSPVRTKCETPEAESDWTDPTHPNGSNPNG